MPSLKRVKFEKARRPSRPASRTESVASRSRQHPIVDEDEDDNRVADERLLGEKRIPLEKVLKENGYRALER